MDDRTKLPSISNRDNNIKRDRLNSLKHRFSKMLNISDY